MGLVKYCPTEAGNSSDCMHAMHIAEGAHFGFERYKFLRHSNIRVFLSWSICVKIERRVITELLFYQSVLIQTRSGLSCN